MTNREEFAKQVIELARQYNMTYQDINSSLVLVFNEDKKPKKESKSDPYAFKEVVPKINDRITIEDEPSCKS